jgi:hypothetical protein
MSMGLYLTIPDIVESEPLLSLSPSHDGLTYSMTLAVGDTSIRLFHASEMGEYIPLAVLTTDVQIVALDSVYVTDVWISAVSSIASLSLAAQAVRYV